jgi:hypothetical protein
MEGDSSPNADVARVAVRLPEFWTNRTASWFAQAEAQFHLAGVTSEHTKFYYVIAQLGENYVEEADDIINSPPQRDSHPKNRVAQTVLPIQGPTYAEIFRI